MKVKRVEGGLLIPDEYLRKLGEDIEIITKPFAIIIIPKTVTRQVAETSKSSVDTCEITQEEEIEDKQPSPPRRSSPHALLEFIKHADGWKGDDLKELLEEVDAFRGRF
jgi:hypothetical protein